MNEPPSTSLSPSHQSRVGFFGGSFDPPHLGHLAVARAARDALHLDRVLFAPVGAQPLKPHGSTAPFADRVTMTERAIAGEQGFEVSLADAPNSGNTPNYTLDTLQNLRARLPAGGCLFCLMGADSFVSLRRWHGAALIPFVASLVVASRPGQQLDDLARFLPDGFVLEHGSKAVTRTFDLTAIELHSYLLRNREGLTASFYLLPGLDVEISASDIRSQIRSSAQDSSATGSPLPRGVGEYIRSHGLYLS